MHLESSFLRDDFGRVTTWLENLGRVCSGLRFSLVSFQFVVFGVVSLVLSHSGGF